MFTFQLLIKNNKPQYFDNLGDAIQGIYDEEGEEGIEAEVFEGYWAADEVFEQHSEVFSYSSVVSH